MLCGFCFCCVSFWLFFWLFFSFWFYDFPKGSAVIWMKPSRILRGVKPFEMCVSHLRFKVFEKRAVCGCKDLRIYWQIMKIFLVLLVKFKLLLQYCRVAKVFLMCVCARKLIKIWAPLITTNIMQVGFKLIFQEANINILSSWEVIAKQNKPQQPKPIEFEVLYPVCSFWKISFKRVKKEKNLGMHQEL